MTAWLIESGRTTYWSGKAVDEWTEKHEDAVRFARFADAEVVRCYLVPPEQRHLVRAVCHQWVEPTTEEK